MPWKFRINFAQLLASTSKKICICKELKLIIITAVKATADPSKQTSLGARNHFSIHIQKNTYKSTPLYVCWTKLKAKRNWLPKMSLLEVRRGGALKMFAVWQCEVKKLLASPAKFAWISFSHFPKAPKPTSNKSKSSNKSL